MTYAYKLCYNPFIQCYRSSKEKVSFLKTQEARHSRLFLQHQSASAKSLRTVTTQQNSDRRVLQLNVGFLLKEGVGTTRVVSFDEPYVTAEEVELRHLKGDLELTRTAHGILVQGELQAETPGECVRCLSEAVVEVLIELSDHFVYPPASTTESEYSVSEGDAIDLAPLLREQAILATPMHVLCRPNCRGLCSQCGQNLNEGQCDCEHSAIDPRLAALKNLLED